MVDVDGAEQQQRLRTLHNGTSIFLLLLCAYQRVRLLVRSLGNIITVGIDFSLGYWSSRENRERVSYYYYYYYYMEEGGGEKGNLAFFFYFHLKVDEMRFHFACRFLLLCEFHFIFSVCSASLRSAPHNGTYTSG